jgi:hypothetical protein
MFLNYKMSGNCPFSSNSNYTRLFKVQSTDRCDNAETVELYQHKTTKEYLLYRYTHRDNTYPLKVIHKFTSILGYEITEERGFVSLLITTVYGNTNIISQRFNACCGSKIHVLQVENEIIRTLF